MEQVKQFVDSSQGTEFSGSKPQRKISVDRGDVKEVQDNI
jgi:hypothetical protein